MFWLMLLLFVAVAMILAYYVLIPFLKQLPMRIALWLAHWLMPEFAQQGLVATMAVAEFAAETTQSTASSVSAITSGIAEDTAHTASDLSEIAAKTGVDAITNMSEVTADAVSMAEKTKSVSTELAGKTVVTAFDTAKSVKIVNLTTLPAMDGVADSATAIGVTSLPFVDMLNTPPKATEAALFQSLDAATSSIKIIGSASPKAQELPNNFNIANQSTPEKPNTVVNEEPKTDTHPHTEAPKLIGH